MLLEWAALPPGAWSRGLLAAAGGVGLGAAARRLGRPATVPPDADGSPARRRGRRRRCGFVEQGQRADGGFDVTVGRDPALRDGEAARCVFETAFIARILEPLDG